MFRGLERVRSPPARSWPVISGEIWQTLSAKFDGPEEWIELRVVKLRQQKRKRRW